MENESSNCDLYHALKSSFRKATMRSKKSSSRLNNILKPNKLSPAATKHNKEISEVTPKLKNKKKSILKLTKKKSTRNNLTINILKLNEHPSKVKPSKSVNCINEECINLAPKLICNDSQNTIKENHNMKCSLDESPYTKLKNGSNMFKKFKNIKHKHFLVNFEAKRNLNSLKGKLQSIFNNH